MIADHRALEANPVIRPGVPSLDVDVGQRAAEGNGYRTIAVHGRINARGDYRQRRALRNVIFGFDRRFSRVKDAQAHRSVVDRGAHPYDHSRTRRIRVVFVILPLTKCVVAAELPTASLGLEVTKYDDLDHVRWRRR